MTSGADLCRASGNCANCQTGGKLLADRSMSRLLKSDWPKTLTELEETATRNTETSPKH